MTSQLASRGPERRRVPDPVVMLAGGIGNQALTFISGPIVARLLGPHGRGEVVTVLAVSLLVGQLVLASLLGSISRAVAASHAPARDAVGAFIPRWVAWVGLASVASGAVSMYVLRDSPSVIPLAALSVGFTFLGGVISLTRSMAYGENRGRSAVVADLTFTACYVAVIAILFVTLSNSSPTAILLGYLGAQAVGLAAMRRALLPGTGDTDARASRSEIARFARASYVSGLGALDRLGFDALVIGQMLGAATLGLYSVAASIGTLPAVMVGILAAPLLPKMVAVEPSVGAAILRRWMLLVVGVFVLVVPVMWVMTGPVIRIFFGADFVGSTFPAQLLLVANAAFGLRLLLAAGALAQNREKAASLVALGATPAVIAAIAIGAHLGGLTGAATGMVVVSLATCAVLACIVSWSGRGVSRARTANM